MTDRGTWHPHLKHKYREEISLKTEKNVNRHAKLHSAKKQHMRRLQSDLAISNLPLFSVNI